MRALILIIFAICMAGTCKAQDIPRDPLQIPGQWYEHSNDWYLYIKPDGKWEAFAQKELISEGTWMVKDSTMLHVVRNDGLIYDVGFGVTAGTLVVEHEEHDGSWLFTKIGFY